MGDWFEWLDLALRVSAGFSVAVFGGMALMLWLLGLGAPGATPTGQTLRYVFFGAALCAICVAVLAMARWPHQAAAWLPLQASHALWMVRAIVYVVGLAGVVLSLRQFSQLRGR